MSEINLVFLRLISRANSIFIRYNFCRKNTAWFIVVATFAINSYPIAIHAQASTDSDPPPTTADNVDQRYTSIRIDVYSKYFKKVEENNWGLRLRLKATAAIYKYEAFSDLVDPEIDHFQSVGMRPKLEFNFPLPIENLSFAPNIELAWNYMLDSHQNLISGSAAVGLQYLKKGDQKDLFARLEAKYGTRYLEDGQNLDDFVELSIEAELRRGIQFNMGKRKLSLTPIGKISNFIDELEFITDSGIPFGVDRTYEIGLNINTLPKLRIGSIKLPDLRISYIFGEDFKGIKIRL